MADDSGPKGPYCPGCGNYLPSFPEVDPETERSIRASADQEFVQAVKLLRRKTGCDLATAKLWLQHPNGPTPPKPPGPPCPHCGEPLRTAKAQQCFACGADWHNEQDS